MNNVTSQKVVVFALTSLGNDYYSAMTRVAVASLRQSNPAIQLIVVCDHETDRAVKQASNLLIGEVDEWISLETPLGDAFFRSRYVKTSLRRVIEGPFLFLDSDIFVRGNLGPIFDLDADIAGARNHSRSVFTEQVWDLDAVTIEEMGWQVSQANYLNTGVIFFNDTERAKQLGAEWHRRWLSSLQICGKHYDQPSFNSALFAIQPRISILPDRYNAQFKVTTAVAHGAVLWHYYSSDGDVPHTQFELLADDLVRGARLDVGRIAAMQKSGHPWRRDSTIDDWAATGVVRRSRFDGWEAAWLQREIRRYIWGRVRGIAERIKRTITTW